MPRNTLQSLGYRVWNQTRLAHHVDSMFQIYEGLAEPMARGTTWLPNVQETVRWMHNATYQSIIVHLDMIMPSQGASLYAMISEAHDQAKIAASTAAALRSKIDEHTATLKNIRRQRNNLVAHRSMKETFAEVRAAFPVEMGPLRDLVSAYYEVAADLYTHVPFSNAYPRRDETPGLDALLNALCPDRGRAL